MSKIACCLAAAALTALASASQAQPAQYVPVPVPQRQAAPPRVAMVTVAEGSVVFAPAGQTEWSDLPRGRPLTRGDRLWTDEGARAELHFGTSVVHMDSRTFVEVVAIDPANVQLAVNEGTVNVRVRELRPGDEFEVTTPQLGLYASPPGDWRIDVDAQHGMTRVAAHGGTALVYGASQNVLQVLPGQQVAFTGRDLAQPARVPQAAAGAAFDRWAADRNRFEEQALLARRAPRDTPRPLPQRSVPREVPLGAQPYWRGGEEGGYPRQ
jgi:hypothetical protein